jgi:hypothetical protein
MLCAAVAEAGAGRGALVLVEGPAGIGKTSLLRAACARRPAAGMRILTARGLALERGFPYGIARQLIEPVRAAAGPGKWDELLDGAAGLAARVFDWAEAGAVEDDLLYATAHGLYWLVANLATSGPLMIVVDDAHWADEPSLRWLAHLAAASTGCRSRWSWPCAAVRTSRSCSTNCVPARCAPGCGSAPSTARRPPRCYTSGSASRQTPGCARPAMSAPAETRSCLTRWPVRWAACWACWARTIPATWPDGWHNWRRSRSPRRCCGGSAS